MKNTIPLLIKKDNLILWAGLIAAFIACFYPTFEWLHYKYSGGNSYFSHGYLIPFVSAYLIYQMRDELKCLHVSSSLTGFVIIIFALLIHLLGIIGDINFISGFALVGYISGVSLYLFGKSLTSKIAFPLFFLLFMCPVPDAFIDMVALPFKSMATSLSMVFFDLLDIPYIREGFKIHFADSTFVVGSPCNGMRSLISFFALGFLFLYFIRSKWWKKGLLLLVIPPVSIVLNGLRIAILLYIANTFGQEAASPESFLHDGSGLVVFLLGLGFMYIFVRYVVDTKKT